MKKALFPGLLLFAVFLALAWTPAQTTAPKFARYNISDSGCKIFLPAKPDPVTMDYSPDTSKVYTIECLDSTYKSFFHFGSIVVDLKDTLKDGEVEDMLIAYLDYLKTAFNITEAAGYGKGHTLSTHPSAKGVIDFWKDKDGDEWSIKAWGDRHILFVMFIYGPKEYPNYNVKEVFFNGARFPGDN